MYMKKNWGWFILFSFIVTTFIGCNKTKDTPAITVSYLANAKVKRIYLYSSETAKDPISITDEYEYDKAGRISKITHPFYKDGVVTDIVSYDLYEYNTAGRVEKIKNYNKNLVLGYINIQNTIYTYYKDGNKEKETIEYPQISATEYSLFVYNTNNKLIKAQKFDTKGNLLSYTLSDYDKTGLLVKETLYAADNKALFYTQHSYSGGKLIKSDVYNAFNKEKVREITRRYDNNNNLLVVVSKELSLYSSMMDNVLKYEYYETGLTL